MRDQNEIREIIQKSQSLSEAARIIFGDDKTSSREKVKILSKELSVTAPNFYNRHNYCLFCGKEIVGRDRFRKKFCSQSCAASYNNKDRERKHFRYCLNCGNQLKNRGKYCSKECENNYRYKRFIKKWSSGEVNGSNSCGETRDFVRRYLLEKYDEKCQICGFNKKNPFTGNSILQVHHIDGDCFNGKESNLQLLCPNCHAMTSNFGSRNANSTRRDKRTKYYKELILSGLI